MYETSQHRKDYYALKFAFESLGHQVDVFDWPKYLYEYQNASLANRLKDRLLFARTVHKINRDLVRIIERTEYDLWLVVRGDHILPETLLMAKNSIPRIFNWNSDDFFNPRNNTKHMLACFGLYDCHFSPRAHLKNEYIARGAKAFEFIRWYYRPGLFFAPETVAAQKTVRDIAFVGSWSKRRENILKSLQSREVNIWGWGWGKKSERSFLRTAKWRPHVDMISMMDVFGTSKINVNILTLENRDTTNFRNFEIPAAGGFQLSERSDEILNTFDEDKEIVCFESADELVSKCDYYLKNDGERKKIALNGYSRLFGGNYSIVDRAKQILDRAKQ